MSVVTRKQKRRRNVLVMLFGLPFLGFGVGFGYFKVWPEFSYWLDARSWQYTEGQLLSYRLNTAKGSEGGSTYSISARFRFEVSGHIYESSRYGIHTGNDNIGNYHQQQYQRLQRIERDQLPLTVWYDPADPNQAVVDRDLRWGLMLMQAVFAVVFALVGLVVVIVGWFGKAQSTGVGAEPMAGEMAAPFDFSDRQPISPSVTGQHWMMWLFATLWNLIAFPACFAAMDEISRIQKTEDYLLLLILLFPLVGVFLVWQAIKGSILYVRYGKSLLRLDPNPGQAGGQVGGDIELSKPLPLDAQCEIRLECQHSYETRNSKGHKRISTSVSWQDSITVRGRREAGKTRVQFLFDVPADLPATQPKSTDWHHWQLHICADIPGLDLALDFEVPVQKGEAKSRIRIPGHARQQQLQRSQQLAQVLNVEQRGDTLFMHSRYGRELAGSVMAALFGAIFFGVGVGIGVVDMGAGLLEWPVKLLFCTVFGGIGLLLLLAGIATPTTRLETAIDRHSVHVRRWFLGKLVYQKSIALDRVSQLETHKKSSNSNGKHMQNWFEIRLQHNTGKQPIAESIPGRVLADEALAFLRNNTGLP